jgi:hypothetical protein
MGGSSGALMGEHGCLKVALHVAAAMSRRKNAGAMAAWVDRVLLR